MELSLGERKQGLRLKLTNYLRNNAGKWIRVSTLEKLSQELGYLAETGRRRLREMTQPEHHAFNGWIEKEEFDGIVHYKYLV